MERRAVKTPKEGEAFTPASRWLGQPRFSQRHDPARHRCLRHRGERQDLLRLRPTPPIPPASSARSPRRSRAGWLSRACPSRPDFRGSRRAPTRSSNGSTTPSRRQRRRRDAPPAPSPVAGERRPDQGFVRRLPRLRRARRRHVDRIGRGEGTARQVAAWKEALAIRGDEPRADRPGRFCGKFLPGGQSLGAVQGRQTGRFAERPQAAVRLNAEHPDRARPGVQRVEKAAIRRDGDF